MCCRNFFRFTLICSAFQILLGSSVMAEGSASNVVKSYNIEDSSSQSVDNKETGNSENDDDTIEISVSLEKEQPVKVKEIKMQIILDQGSNDSVNSDSLPVTEPVTKPVSESASDGSFEQKSKEFFQEKKDAIVSKIQSLRDSFNRIYSKSDSKDRKFLESLKSCEFRAKVVGDNEKTLQMDLVSSTPVKETVLLEKTPLDEKNNRYAKINLINR